MPLVIPGERNLSQEAFTSFLIGLQERRAREEEAKRREEAADPGGAGIGTGVGAAAGTGLALILAGPTGGASIAAAPLFTTVGAGIGGIVGSIVDPPGSGIPGGQSGQIGTGLQRIAGGVTQEIARRVTVKEKQETKVRTASQNEVKFLTGLAQTFGPLAVEGYADYKQGRLNNAKTTGQPAPLLAEIQADFAGIQAQRASTSRDEQITGRIAAKKRGDIEATQVQLGRQSVADLSKAFIMTPGQVNTANNFATQLEAIHSAADGKELTPEEAADQLASFNQRRDRFFLRLQKRPPERVSVQQMRQANKPLQRGGLYYNEEIPNSVVSVTEGGLPVTYVPPLTVIPNPQNPNERLTFDPKGKAMVDSFRLPSGRWVSPGEDYTIEGESGLFQKVRRPDGSLETKQVPGTGADGGDAGGTFDVMLETALKINKDTLQATLGKGAEDPAKDAAQLIERVQEESDRLRENALRVQRIREFRQIDDPQAFIDKLVETDPAFRRAFNTLKQAGKLGERGLARDQQLARELETIPETVRATFLRITEELGGEDQVPLAIRRAMVRLHRAAEFFVRKSRAATIIELDR